MPQCIDTQICQWPPLTLGRVVAAQISRALIATRQQRAQARWKWQDKIIRKALPRSLSHACYCFCCTTEQIKSKLLLGPEICYHLFYSQYIICWLCFHSCTHTHTELLCPVSNVFNLLVKQTLIAWFILRHVRGPWASNPLNHEPISKEEENGSRSVISQHEETTVAHVFPGLIKFGCGPRWW